MTPKLRDQSFSSLRRCTRNIICVLVPGYDTGHIGLPSFYGWALSSEEVRLLYDLRVYENYCGGKWDVGEFMAYHHVPLEYSK